MACFRTISWRLALAVSAAALLALALVRCAQQPTTFLSLDPKNEYVGNEACQPCHKKIYASYLETGMGRSLYLPDPDKVIEDFGPGVVVYDSFSNYAYQPFWEDRVMYIREFRLEEGDTAYERVEKVDYIVGSGHQTRSYLLMREDYLYEAPITWYVNKQIWDLSPGYEEGHNSRFQREIGLECMACHTGALEHVKGSKNRYRQISLGIDCERCHGPGKAHVEATEGGQLIDVGEETDYTIVNPAKLPLEKSFDVCQQCHLQGVNVLADDKNVRDFRPGMDLNEVFHVFLEQPEDPEAFGIASHAERLQQSQCFLRSDGKLTCTTCHDPHKSIAVTDTTVYIRQCQSCHRPEKQIQCAAPESERITMGGNCVSCHMAAGGTRDIPHVRFHDHKIRVLNPQPDRDLTAERAYLEKLICATGDSIPSDTWGQAWLRYFEDQDPDPAYLAEAGRRLAADSYYPRARVAFHAGNYPQALDLVKKALASSPEDPFCLFLQGEVLEAQGNYPAALEAYAASFRLNPASIEGGIKAANMLLSANPGDPEALKKATSQFESLHSQKPFDPRLLSNLGFAYLNQQNLPQAEFYLSKALAYDPDYLQAMENMAYLRLFQGRRAQAQEQYERLILAHPQYPGKETLRQRLGL